MKRLVQMKLMLGMLIQPLFSAANVTVEMLLSTVLILVVIHVTVLHVDRKVGLSLNLNLSLLMAPSLGSPLRTIPSSPKKGVYMFQGETVLTGCKLATIEDFGVMHSAAGWYVGTCSDMGPITRETDYFHSETEAGSALKVFKETGELPCSRT